jgi:hypothetical protein
MSKGQTFRDNSEPFEAGTEYGDLTRVDKGTPLPVIGGEQLVPLTFISTLYRSYTEVAPDQKPGKK